MKRLSYLIKDESGQALSEYGLVLAIVVIAAIVVLTTLKDKVIALFNKISTALSI